MMRGCAAVPPTLLVNALLPGHIIRAVSLLHCVSQALRPQDLLAMGVPCPAHGNRPWQSLVRDWVQLQRAKPVGQSFHDTCDPSAPGLGVTRRAVWSALVMLGDDAAASVCTSLAASV